MFQKNHPNFWVAQFFGSPKWLVAPGVDAPGAPGAPGAPDQAATGMVDPEVGPKAPRSQEEYARAVNMSHYWSWNYSFSNVKNYDDEWWWIL